MILLYSIRYLIELESQKLPVFASFAAFASVFMICDALREDALREDALREDALREDTLREDALREDTLREDALREDTLREDALREDALREDALTNNETAPASNLHTLIMIYCMRMKMRCQKKHCRSYYGNIALL